MKYTLTGKRQQIDSEIEFEVAEQILSNESFGDQIGLCTTSNSLWLHEDTSLNDLNIHGFIENYFNRPIQTYQIISEVM